MEEYIEEALKQEFIHPSTSPAASSFFFFGKKDGGLGPCTDYRTLNLQTITYRYPFPLVHLYLELEKCSAVTPFTSLVYVINKHGI